MMHPHSNRESHFGLFIVDIYIGGHIVEINPACFVRIGLMPGTYFIGADDPNAFGAEDGMTFEVRERQVVFCEYKPIERRVVPGEKIIQRSLDEAISTFKYPELCVSPKERLSDWAAYSHIEVTMGDSARPSLAWIILRFELDAAGNWICDIDKSAASGWLADYRSRGCTVL